VRFHPRNAPAVICWPCVPSGRSFRGLPAVLSDLFRGRFRRKAVARCYCRAAARLAASAICGDQSAPAGVRWAVRPCGADT
jgi:hypothetical protein